jgi:CRP-like cAMP-binding protein
MWNPPLSNAQAVGRSAYLTPLVNHHELQALWHPLPEPSVEAYAPLRDGRESVRMPLRPDARQNRILDALPEADLSALLPYLERVELSSGRVIGQPGELAQQVFFPINCTASLVSHTADGESAELAQMGHEGLIGVTLVLGGAAMNHSVQVQAGGLALRMQADVFMRQQAQRPALQQLALLYAQFLMGQMAQSIVCSRHHSVTQRLTHWVLSHADGQASDALQVTHENISQMLGVRRESVTQSAGKLQASGLIGNGRGKILLKNREGLRAMACECYARSEAETARYFQQVTHRADLTRQSALGAASSSWQQDGLKGGYNGVSSSASGSTVSAWVMAGPAGRQTNGHANGAGNGHAEGTSVRDDACEDGQHRDDLDNLPTALQKYVDAYDFAPVGFVTLDAQGRIVQTNLAGAILLDIQRSQCQHSLFAHFLDHDSHAIFQQFHQEVLGGKCRRHCEVVLSATAHQPQRVVRIDATLDDEGQECRLVLIDLSL